MKQEQETSQNGNIEINFQFPPKQKTNSDYCLPPPKSTGRTTWKDF